MDRNQKKLCPNCNVQVAAAHMARHRRTEKCLNFGSGVPVPEKRCPSCNQTITLPKKMVNRSTQVSRSRAKRLEKEFLKRSSQKSDSTIESQAPSGESKKRLASDSKSCQKAVEQNSTESPQAPPQSKKRLTSDPKTSRKISKVSKSRRALSDLTTEPRAPNQEVIDKSDESS